MFLTVLLKQNSKHSYNISTMNKEELIEAWKVKNLNQKGLNELIRMFIEGEDKSCMNMKEVCFDINMPQTPYPIHTEVQNNEKE